MMFTSLHTSLIQCNDAYDALTLQYAPLGKQRWNRKRALKQGVLPDGISFLRLRKMIPLQQRKTIWKKYRFVATLFSHLKSNVNSFITGCHIKRKSSLPLQYLVFPLYSFRRLLNRRRTTSTMIFRRSLCASLFLDHSLMYDERCYHGMCSQFAWVLIDHRSELLSKHFLVHRLILLF